MLIPGAITLSTGCKRGTLQALATGAATDLMGVKMSGLLGHSLGTTTLTQTMQGAALSSSRYQARNMQRCVLTACNSCDMLPATAAMLAFGPGSS